MNEPDYYLMNPVKRLSIKVFMFFRYLPRRAAGWGKTLGHGALGAAKGLANFVLGIGRMFRDGDVFVRLSYIFMGLGCMARRQIVKGMLFLACEAGFVLYLLNFGWNYLKDIATLGSAEQEIIGYSRLGTPLYSAPDNSMLILLYSVMTIIVIAVFVLVWAANVKSAYRACLNRREGRPNPRIIDDLRSLLDGKYHITLLTAPTLFACAFVILPLIFMVLIAFTNYDASHQPPGNLFTWVGLSNFQDVLWNNPLKSHTFRYLLQWTVIWAVFATFSNYILGMLLAMLINKKGIKLKKFWRTIFVTTIAVPQFVSLLIMSKIFYDQGTGGPMNIILKSLGFGMVQFFTNGTLARVMVIVINMWVGIPYSMLICSGILMNIPADLYESARIDGAGPVKTFTKITLPYMLFVTTPYLITQFVGNFNNFNVIYLLTQGNPRSLNLYQAGETDLLVTWLYKLTVNFSDYNLASVIGIFVFLISAVLSLIVYNSSSSVKNEEAFQ